jgi:hypothetical protein
MKPSRTAELLEVVPGLIVTQHSGDGKANQYFMRTLSDHMMQCICRKPCISVMSSS